MHTLADYWVIQRSKGTIGRGHPHHTLFFDCYSDIRRSGSSKRPVLTFFVDPIGDVRNMTMTAALNGGIIFTYRYSGGVGRTHNVVIDHYKPDTDPPQPFIEESGNRLHFECHDEGDLSISNVVLWFQRNIEE